MIRTTLKRLLDASDWERISGYNVDAYDYRDGTDGFITFLNDAGEALGEFDQQQIVELDLGSAIAVDAEGTTYNIEFFVTRALQDEDVL